MRIKMAAFHLLFILASVGHAIFCFVHEVPLLSPIGVFIYSACLGAFLIIEDEENKWQEESKEFIVKYLYFVCVSFLGMALLAFSFYFK